MLSLIVNLKNIIREKIFNTVAYVVYHHYETM